MRLDEECKGCLYNSQLKKVERGQDDKVKLYAFKKEVKALCENPPENYCAPLLMRDIDGIHRKIFGTGINYSAEKKLFNGLLLNLEDEIYEKANSSADPLCEALKFSTAANYIDFARISALDESSLKVVFAAAEKAQIQEEVLNSLKNRLKNAKTLCYLHDNCGEIVLDKILIRIIKERYPQISVISVVRGGDIINDVTREDARFINLEKYSRVIDNGTNVPGTYLKEVSAECLNALTCADAIISKGLGNLETLYGEGLRAFYAFNCKCAHIGKRFNLPLWSAALIEER